MEAIQQRISTAAQVDEQGLSPQRPGRKRGPNFKMMLKNREMQAALGSGVMMLAAWGISGSYELISIVLYIAAYTIGGWAKAKEGVETLVKDRDLDVNLLMIAAAMGAAAIGYWNEGAMLIFIFALSGALESYTTERSHKDISSLIGLKPETALRLKDGAVEQVAIELLQPGDLLLVKPGEILPSDGKVYKGYSAVNQASITGESIPVEKSAGDEVYAGTMNGEGALYIEVTQPADNTLFSKIIKLVEEAQSEVPASQRFIEKFEGIYAKLVVLITLVLVLAMPLLFGIPWGDAFYKAMVFLVVASPCALVASIMPVMLSSISSSARRGLLFKGGAHVENMAKTAVVAFDKTGTLTRGVPEVTDLIAASGYDEMTLLSHAAAVESQSTHPLAEAIAARAIAAGAQRIQADDVQNITGWGIKGRIAGQLWKVGKTDVLDETDADPAWIQLRSELEREGKTVSVIMQEDHIAGLIAMRDTVRPQAMKAVKRLQELGIKVAMLTGDRQATADVIAKETGVDLVYAGLLPEQKVERVRSLREQYGHVVMVGDGVNDAPALAAATVGMGMGMSGSGTAIEVADVVLMNDNIEEIAWSVTQSRRAARVVKQNIVFAISVITILIAGNFISELALPLGVIGHEGSTILVILNGLRLLR
ncbi:heavy metal translocating P-type ATPase [Paenibacillus urinalis]|uniref:Heavy metal translocating P-type ATPase n=1 Tax=Paenibacillus urinalis TaxID=521520 RepID=A0ABY7X808_9BACL|nr:heavy metal translocating P-type ATPase [Paenibacillus urinalis]WDH98103.1 heavy metal translocating P-type ATPase [Paenibacillus urinalis]WDI01786.1 heavy metal translocating P-type ATPase [Paenibacillus urinalis]